MTGCPKHVPLARAMACLSLLACLLAAGPATRPTTGESKPAKVLPQPRAEYKPEQVVLIVMDALQVNDANDSGIETVFNFASPQNKKVTGPLARFIPLLKNPVYTPMLNFKSAAYEKAEVDDDVAVQLVTLVAADGEEVAYLFQLSRQRDGEYKGCWMTDGVTRVVRKGQKA